MKTLAAALITSLLVFTLATAWMELVQPRMELMAQASASKNREIPAKSSTRRNSRRISSDDEDFDDDEAVVQTAPKVATKASRTVKRQREESALTEPTKERLIAQLAEVKQQESKLLAREETLRMLYDDIRSELGGVEDIRQKSAAELAIAEKRILDVATKKTNGAPAGDSANGPLAASKPKVSPEARIAGVIQDLASQGNVAAAASLLSGMKDREVAKVLTSLSARDPRLALRLSDQVQSAKQEPLRR